MTVRATFSSPAAGLRQPRNQAHRVLACCAIILGHCEAATGLDPTTTGRVFQHALNIVAQYAVPLFFVLAGYSLAPKLTRPLALRDAARYTRRILTLLVLTSVSYFIFGAFANAKLGDPLGMVFKRQAVRLLNDPATLALAWPGHLWFLVGLIVAVWTTVWFRSRARLRSLVVMGCVFYAVLLMTGPYAPVVGWPALPRWRVTLLVGTPFMIVGLVLRHLRTLPPVRTAYLLIALGLLFHASELYWLWSWWGVSPFGMGALAGTALYTVGASLLAVRPEATALSRLLGRFGSLTLIAYLVHVAFIELLRPHRFAFDRPMWRLVFPFTVAILSFTFAATYFAASKAARRYYRDVFGYVDQRTV